MSVSIMSRKEEGYPSVLQYAVSFYKKDCVVQGD